MKINMCWRVSALLLLAGLVACGSPPAGDATRGEAVFNLPVPTGRGSLQPCASCHSIVKDQPSKTGLGTNFYNIATRAAVSVPGQTAQDYLRTSIVNPDAHLAGGFQDGLMSREYAKLLTAQQIEDVVAYMLTLK